MDNLLRRHRNAKIIATLGPASSDEAVIRGLFVAGADVFRLNLSHGDHAGHKARYDIIRALETETGRPICVLLDLQGPKLRIGRFAAGAIELSTGQGFRLDLAGGLGDETRVSLPHPEIFAAIASGTELLLDDGKIRLRVLTCDDNHAETEVIAAGALSANKGVNLPGVALPIAALTEKDRRDLQFGLELGVDWIALSFVQRPEDIAEARKLVSGRAAVMAKLEKPSAIDRLDEIIAIVDGIMVARGDLGVEMAPESVPGLQKEIIARSRSAGKPVVVATQMLESMIEAATPTRAEASDVATAVYDGADALMLSAESAAGAYPIEAVAMMSRIIAETERDPRYRRILTVEESDLEPTAADAITAAADQVSRTIRAVAICAYSMSGSTTLRASRERPLVPILGLTPIIETARRLAIAWGVHNVLTPDATSFTDMVEKACNLALDEGFAVAGDRIVVTAGVPFGTPGSTNTLRIAMVGQGG